MEVVFELKNGRSIRKLASFTQPKLDFEELVKIIEGDKKRDLKGTSRVGRELLEDYGKDLFNSVFRGEVKETYERFKNELNSIKLILSQELMEYPWELMHDGDEFISTSIPIVRSSGLTKVVELRYPIKILFVAAQPYEAEKLNLEGQVRRICKKLNELVDKGCVQIRCLTGKELELTNLKKEIQRCDVLHISGHGDITYKNVLVFDDGSGSAIELSLDTLAAWLKDSQVKLVCLDACRTARPSIRTLTDFLRQSGVCAVIGMQFKISDEAATRFSEGFYPAFVDKGIYEEIKEGRKAMLYPKEDYERIDWAIPALYVQNDLVVRGDCIEQRRFFSPEKRIFVGREGKMDEVVRFLINPDVNAVLIYGFGGIGKTTLARQVAEDIRGLYRDVCWIDLRIDSSFDLVVRRINDMFELHGMALTDFGMAEDVMREIANRINGFLIVFDNFDEVEDDLISKLLREIEGKCKLLITVRDRRDLCRMQASVLLEKLKEEEAIDLMRRFAEAKGINLWSVEDEKLKELNKKVDGHPKAIEVAVSHLRYVDIDSLLKVLPEVLADDITPVLEWTYKRLSDAEREALRKTSVFDRASFEVLNCASIGIKAIQKLGDYGLLDLDEKYYSLHPIIKEFAYKELERDDEEKKNAHTKAAECLLEEFKRERDCRHLISALDHYYKAERWKEYVDVSSKYYDEIVTKGFWRDAVRICQLGIQVAKKIHDARAVWFIGELGSMMYRMGKLDKALKYHETVLKIFEEVEHKSGIAATLHNIAMVYQQRGDYDKAMELYEESIKIEKELGDKLGVAYTLAQLGLLYKEIGEKEKAIKCTEEALKMFERMGLKRDAEKVRKQLKFLKYG